jgi:hypothetical protein
MGTVIVSRALPTLYSPFRNICDNGGMEVWQRGTSFSSPANGSMLADRWTMFRPGISPTFSVAQEGTIVDNGNFSMKIQITSPGVAGTMAIYQSPENYKAYFNQYLSVSARIWCNVPNSVQINLVDTANHISTFHPGDSTYHTLTTSALINPAATNVWLYITMDPTQVSTLYIDSVMITFGSQPVNYTPLHPADELARCLRYYEASGPDVGEQVITLVGGSTDTQIWKTFKVQKYAVPTVTLTPVNVELDQSPSQGTSSTGNDQSNWVQSAGSTNVNGFAAHLRRNASTAFNYVAVQQTWSADTGI